MSRLINRAKNWLEEKSSLEWHLKQMKDDRENVEILPATIARVVIEMVLRGQSSLLQADQDARHPEMCAWHGSQRPMVASDTTLFRSLGTFALEPIRAALWANAQQVCGEPHKRAELPSGRRVHLGLIDGSGWGGFLGSVLTIAGASIDVVAGYEMSPGKGHELAVSRRVLKEAVGKLGRGFVDLLVGDGLYFTVEDFMWAQNEAGCHLLVKTKEETLTVIEDARGLFFSPAACIQQELERSAGYDARRGCEYKIIAAPGFMWNGVKLKVAYVSEKYSNPKPGHPEETGFWVVTTDQDLSAEDMRETAHLRWSIENRTFRRLSHLVDSKRRITGDAHVREALLGLWFMGLNLFNFLMCWLPRVLKKDPKYRVIKKTWNWVYEEFKRLTIILHFCRIED